MIKQFGIFHLFDDHFKVKFVGLPLIIRAGGNTKNNNFSTISWPWYLDV